ncbi:bifunctional diaminohydroxyphosphoribosylaminopyrimidine deaminase/5-amino-6-(5-phosphoribosylamino)uracil reductase RibD, partial [Candidatus Gottesmanbacteria bacterium]|nr:bifunctional diaminohydroxyphosphoribosylaminopyrimidine deaminase/5-amino-6-(5-phosphoribosylamino)uracil reductase RibD [Candidatus Gottesmanbacteria bacterium]
MKQAFHLAKKGLSWTNPHPMVGAVIVKNGKIIARGYHHSFGGDHAEMDAIKNAEADIKRATMYVTLEPCHLPYDLHGPRIPCIKIIHQAGIRTVHIAMLDSNPEVAGRGRQELEKMDIRTTLGVLGRQVHELNETYHHFMKRRRPFIAATFSVSLDGKIATRTSDSKWITHKKARQFVMNNLWPSYQAVLVGINTVIQDNEPMKITNNLYKNPLRIVLDSHLRIPIGSNFLWDDNVIIATTHFA